MSREITCRRCNGVKVQENDDGETVACPQCIGKGVETVAEGTFRISNRTYAPPIERTEQQEFEALVSMSNHIDLLLEDLPDIMELVPESEDTRTKAQEVLSEMERMTVAEIHRRMGR